MLADQVLQQLHSGEAGDTVGGGPGRGSAVYAGQLAQYKRSLPQREYAATVPMMHTMRAMNGLPSGKGPKVAKWPYNDPDGFDCEEESLYRKELPFEVYTSANRGGPASSSASEDY
jgi:hypothetical protein